MLEEVTNRTFRSLLQEEVFQPLNMHGLEDKEWGRIVYKTFSV